MHVLFAHNNFPAQFRFIAPRLASDYGWRCTFVTRNAKAPDVPGVERVVYALRSGAVAGSHVCARTFQHDVGHAHGIYEALKHRPDVRPDLVVAHSGFGASLFMPQLYDAPVINFFEYFRRVVGGCFGYRPEVPVDEAELLRQRTSNAMILLDLDNCDRGWCPNFAQRDAMPKEYHDKIEVIPEGVDTELYQWTWCEPSPDAVSEDPSVPAAYSNSRWLPDGTCVDSATRVVTYVARGFELSRGFDVFMDAARRIYERFPDVLFVVAGTDKSYYMDDRKVTGGKSLRRQVLESGDFDPSKFHFMGWLPEQKLAQVLSAGDLHVYLTVPFITSWSMLDAMSCSCVVLASDQACTSEYITHGRNGLLCDFFDAEGIAKQAVEVLKDPKAYRPLGVAARRTVEKKYSLDVCLPRIKRLFEEVVAKGPRTPSVRCEGLVHVGKRAYWSPSREFEVGPEVGVELAPFEGVIPFRAAPAPCHSERGEESHVPCARDERSFAALRMTEGAGSGVHSAQGNGGGKTILLTWELGAGYGHLMQLSALAQGLVELGYTVVVALRHLERAAEVFGRAGVFYLPAPYKSAAPARFPRAQAYAQFLANLGFGDDDELFGLACAWRNLIRSVGPDLLIGDHSPTAMLAARAFPDLKRAVIGSGFCVPPARQTMGGEAPRPWAVLRPAEVARDPAPALAVEAEVLSRVNWLLENWGENPIERLGQLYDVDETFLTTFPELDHFPDRQGAAYWGPALADAASAGGEAPVWPDGQGNRAFAYLKATPSAGDVVRTLARLGCPTLAYLDGATPAMRQRLRTKTVHVADKRLDVARAAAECDVAVLNGGHGVVCEMLLAGKPILAVPLVLEQQMTGEALRRLGAGDSAPPRRGEPWEWTGRAKLEAVLNDGRYAAGARRFAERYAAFDRAAQREAMLGRAVGCSSRRARTPRGRTGRAGAWSRDGRRGRLRCANGRPAGRPERGDRSLVGRAMDGRSFAALRMTGCAAPCLPVSLSPGLLVSRSPCLPVSPSPSPAGREPHPRGLRLSVCRGMGNERRGGGRRG